LTVAGVPDRPLSPLGLSTVGLILALDQLGKQIAEAKLPLGEAIPVLPILDLYRVHNTGIAFSLLAGYSGLALIALTLLISAGVLIFWWRADEGGRLATVGYGLILGGALGNLFDRVFRGHVVDFLLLHLGDWTLFVFNLADAALMLGPIVLLFVYYRPRGARRVE
jgi:signal peptidase II